MIDWALRHKGGDGRFAYVAPYYAQAKDIAWGYLKRFTASIPGVSWHEGELRCDLPNGSRIRLYGADNYDRLRGIYLDGVVLDEYGDMAPAAWSEVIRPALADRQGWALFIGTPKGRNHFASLYEAALKDAEWFAMRLRASETGLIQPDELARLRISMSANEYAREMEADFDAAVEGAYFADAIAAMRSERRYGKLGRDALLPVRAFFDIGGTGAKADARAIWLAQVVGREIRVLDWRESVGQPLAADVEWLRSLDYGLRHVVLPHDGATNDRVYAVSYQSALEAAGFDVTVIPNQGAGAAMMRIEAVRRVFPQVWMDERCEGGLAALSAYHERRDDKRNVGLGPNHDWASHSADAFGLMAVWYEQNPPSVNGKRQSELVARFSGAGGWMGA
jgi:hypothetical protein